MGEKPLNNAKMLPPCLNKEVLMAKVYFNTAFEGMSEKDINTWIVFNRKRLVGSAIFTCNDSLTSKVVRWAENWGEKNKEKFTPSHTGSIIEYNKQLYVFDMKPLKATITPLANYLLHTKDTYVLVLRDFSIDEKMFSLNIAEHIGEFYPFMSAIRSVFTKRQSKWRTHCSELHLRELQKQGLFTNLNPEICPDELFYEMTNKHTQEHSKYPSRL